MDDSSYHYNKESFSPQVQLQEGDMISRQLAEAGAELTNCNKIYEDLINKSSVIIFYLFIRKNKSLRSDVSIVLKLLNSKRISDKTYKFLII